MLGLSARNVGEILLAMLGRPVAPAIVRRVARILDSAVEARRPLANDYKAPAFDGVALSRQTSTGIFMRPVPVALGLRPDGEKEIPPHGESAATRRPRPL